MNTFSAKLYHYVGPQAIFDAVDFRFSGHRILKIADVENWLSITHQEVRNEQVIATFVINQANELLINDRHSEHVMCAGGKAVLSAGEISFYKAANGEVSVTEISNQSTGYCPEPTSWEQVSQALTTIGIDFPPYFTSVFDFRRCTNCKSINLIKEQVFECAICEQDLPLIWNF